jgi:hypothetical protein
VLVFLIKDSSDHLDTFIETRSNRQPIDLIDAAISNSNHEYALMPAKPGVALPMVAVDKSQPVENDDLIGLTTPDVKNRTLTN